MLLFHGSKSGIKGDMKPMSREACDFGSGFYMGDKPDQPKGLIAAYPNNKFYEIEYDADGLIEKKFGEDYMSQMEWALFVSYNRAPERMSQYKNVCARYRAYNESYDMIVGPIADDKMTQVMNLFFGGQLCDKAFIEALQYVKLGSQYVLKTDRACEKKRFRIISEHKLTDAEMKLIRAQNTNRINQVNNIIGQIQTKYRRVQDVRFYDEILGEWDRSWT